MEYTNLKLQQFFLNDLHIQNVETDDDTVYIHLKSKITFVPNAKKKYRNIMLCITEKYRIYRF